MTDHSINGVACPSDEDRTDFICILDGAEFGNVKDADAATVIPMIEAAVLSTLIFGGSAEFKFSNKAIYDYANAALVGNPNADIRVSLIS